MLYCQKPHKKAKNTPSPTWCNHQIHILIIEQNSENFVKNSHICSRMINATLFLKNEGWRYKFYFSISIPTPQIPEDAFILIIAVT